MSASIGSMDQDMFVTKRNGSLEIVSFDKILQRIKKIGKEHNIKINYTSLAMKIIDQIFSGIKTCQIDELSAEQCAALSSTLPEYNVLAGRLAISNHHKSTPSSFTKAMKKLHGNVDKHGKPFPLVGDAFYKVVLEHGKVLDAMCDYSRDYLIDYFGFKTLERSYLFRIQKVIVERPQHMWLRVAIGLHGADLVRVEETYHAMSQKYFTHATPTLFNAGTPHPQLSSCFLQAMESDSIEGIYNTVKDCAMISKWAGGIGMHIHNIRAEGSHINGTNGSSNGIVPMLRVFNHTAKYVDQCLDPETLVYTARGAIPIKNVVIGDEVVTDDGQLNRVGKVLDYPDYVGDLYSIQLAGSIYPMKMTDMHPIWCIQPNRTSGHENIVKALHAKLIAPQFVEIKHVWKGDYVGFPIPTYERDITQYTEEDCRFYGIMLGDGNISPDKNLAYVALNKTTKQDTILFVEEYLRKLNIHITYSYANEHYIRLVWSRNSMFKFTYEMLYDDKTEKHVLPHMLHLPKPKIAQLVKGILETDAKVKDYQIILEITSQNIVESVRYMLLRLGTLTSGFLRDRRGESHVSKYGSTITCKKLSYILNVPKTAVVCNLFPHKHLTESKNIRTFFEYKGYLYSRVTDVDKTENYAGRVMDIEIDNDAHHNFLSMNGHIMNGGGKRNGSFAIYLEPWHADVEKFLQMKKNHGDEELKARDLFYALWIPDLFMKRVKENGSWTLMCPDECPGLSDVYGDEFEVLYTGYETAGKGRRTMEARKLWYQILDAQAETSTPYMLSKDNMNRKSNQKNLGTIKSSNLCTEICLYSDDKETAVCNLASIGLPTFVVAGTGTTPPTFDFEKLHAITRVITYNLNRVVDINYYPTVKAERSNRRHRPLGIGIQGLADTFFMMGFAFASPDARKLNRDIFETIYHAALTESCALAQAEGVYETYPGSPISQGIFQFDMWEGHIQTNDRYDWDALRAEIRVHGVRNSTLLAPMPTASTSQILGFNECFEPITSNIYSRRTLAGEFIVTNKYLMRDLIGLGIWNDQIKNQIIQHNGSIQSIAGIPEDMKEKYKTVWEIKMRDVIDMAADRGVYICQSQSMNLWVAQPNYNNLTAMYFYAFEKGLKTMQYYLRRQAAHQAQQFTIEPEKAANANVDEDEDEGDGCVMCSG